jgi:hypothetical protein
MPTATHERTLKYDQLLMRIENAVQEAREANCTTAEANDIVLLVYIRALLQQFLDANYTMSLEVFERMYGIVIQTIRDELEAIRRSGIVRMPAQPVELKLVPRKRERAVPNRGCDGAA